MSYRVDRSPKLASKVSAMYSPRIDGGGVFASRAMPPSPLSKGLEGPPASVSSSGVDYDDVFGGPPRFATSMFAAQAGQVSSATLDRSMARTASFRSPSLPVFELPVFGDDVFGSSKTFEQKPASVAYDDIFKEEVHTPDAFPGGSGLCGNILPSKASSRSSSRRMSPVHPAASISAQLVQEEIIAAANSAAYFKGRSSSGKMSSRNSFSSSSFDDGRKKPLESSSLVSRNDTVGSSLPSSPPHTGTWGHVKKAMGSNAANNLGSSKNGDVDDVFGGFPQRTYSLAFSAARHDASTPSRTHSAPKRGDAGSKAPRSPFTSHSSESYERLTRSFSTSSSSSGEQELQDDFIEIRMDRQSDSSAPEKVESSGGRMWATASDTNVLIHATPKRTPAKPPPSPVPGAQLKHKSWKDWTLDMSLCQPIHPASPGLVRDASATPGTGLSSKKDLSKGSSMSPYKKGMSETGSRKQLENNSTPQLPQGKYTLASPLRTGLTGKLLEDTMDLEERELQAMLTKAWKINENKEKKKNAAARPPRDSPAVFDSKSHELRVEGTRQASKPLSKALPYQQGSQKVEDKEADLHWKSWRKYSSKERKELIRESTRIGSSHESMPTKASCVNPQDVGQGTVDNLAKLNAISETEDAFDPEEMVKVVTEEMSANGPSKESDRWASVSLNASSCEKEVADVETSDNEKPLKVLKDENGATGALSSANDIVQDFVQYSEQQEASLIEVVEDIDSLLGVDASLEGFQDIEGESLERRKSRWVRHLRAKQRAAKAVEEMQQRDAEVQRQQEEKQQLAEAADRQIKRWATGKEGNLRALLSNLQHVLWSDSGWQPISLTDLIEGPDVKKAYRKATLFVHPDKVQQKGATLQQKYIAERVFDFLQEAWKTFNLQELF